MNMKERLAQILLAKSETARLKLLSSYIRESYERGKRSKAPVVLTGGDPFQDSLIGLEVSVDVSTGETDNGSRIFGKIEEVNKCDNEAGFTLLVTDPVYNSNPKHLSFVEAMRFLYAGKAVRPRGYSIWLIKRGKAMLWVNSDGTYSKLKPCFTNIDLEHVWESK